MHSRVDKLDTGCTDGLPADVIVLDVPDGLLAGASDGGILQCAAASQACLSPVRGY